MVPGNSSVRVSDPKATSLNATQMITTANVQHSKTQRITVGDMFQNHIAQLP